VTVSLNLSSVRPEIRLAVEAAQEKHALDIVVLHLHDTGAFAEYFILCSGQSQPQLRAIAEAVEESLDKRGRHLAHREGKAGAAEWLLLDYGNFIVHIFSERAREYYDLERLWRNAERLDISEEHSSHARSSESEPEAGAAHR
jgi:ribosome-associated protein